MDKSDRKKKIERERQEAEDEAVAHQLQLVLDKSQAQIDPIDKKKLDQQTEDEEFAKLLQEAEDAQHEKHTHPAEKKDLIQFKTSDGNLEHQTDSDE